MTHSGDSHKEETSEPKGGRPGPTDQGRDAGMATREVTHDLGTEEDAQEPPD